jgi:hypothetical protein
MAFIKTYLWNYLRKNKKKQLSTTKALKN